MSQNPVLPEENIETVKAPARRGRKTKKAEIASEAAEASAESAEAPAENTEKKPARRGRKPKAETEAEAADLAMAASEAILTLPLADGYSRKNEETLRSDYDTDRDLPHWYGSYTVNCYRPNTD